MNSTPTMVSDMEQEVDFIEIHKARRAFAARKSVPVEFRRKQLLSLLELMNDEENRQRIFEASFRDMRRCSYEVTMSDFVVTKGEIAKCLSSLEKFSTPKYLPRRLLTFRDSACIRYEPHGVVLILGAWNYPFFITIMPLIGAIAAGNCAILKPSEVAGHVANLLAELLPRYLDNECYHVVLGDVDRTKALLANQFDYIFFTGSTSIGREILGQAAKHLTPVTLEMGGKSPVYIHESACTKASVKRIIFPKLFNLGQSCIAPDYVLCSQQTQDSFIVFAKEILNEWYQGRNLQNVPELARIINLKHLQRLVSLLEKTRGTVLIGGKHDEKDLWMEFTCVGNVSQTDSLMAEEIFGPILPLVSVSSVDQAIEFINAKDRPLALYIFSNDDTITQRILDSTLSGGVCINDTMMHAGDVRLPFGGTGKSGMGNYRGDYSIETFSHKRSVVTRGLDYVSEKFGAFRYMPYTEQKANLTERISCILDYTEIRLSPFFSHVFAAIAGFLACVIISTIL